MEMFLGLVIHSLGDQPHIYETPHAIYRLLESMMGGAVEYSDSTWMGWSETRMSEDSDVTLEASQSEHWQGLILSMQFLQDIGYDFNATSDLGWTLLRDAAMSHNPFNVQLLLLYGANPNVRDDATGYGVLHDVVDCGLWVPVPYRVDGYNRTVMLLVKAGCDISATDFLGDTPSSLALHLDEKKSQGFNGRFELWINALAECGIDVFEVLAREEQEYAQTSAIEWTAQDTNTELRRRRPFEEAAEETSEGE